MKRISIAAMLLSMILALSAVVYAGASEGTYGGGKDNRVEIELKLDPIMNVIKITYKHNGETSGPHDATPDPKDPKTVKDAPEVTFSDGKQYRVKDGRVQWSKVGSSYWSNLVKLEAKDRDSTSSACLINAAVC